MQGLNVILTENMFNVYLVAFLTMYPLYAMYNRFRQSYAVYKTKLLFHIQNHQQTYCRSFLVAAVAILLEFMFHGNFNAKDWATPSHLLHAFAIGVLLALTLFLHSHIKTRDLLSSLVIVLTVIIIFNILFAGFSLTDDAARESTPILAAKLIGFQLTNQALQAGLDPF